MSDIHSLIEEFDGLRPLARALGVHQATVAYWRDRGKIPAWRHEHIERVRRTRDGFSVVPEGTQ